MPRRQERLQAGHRNRFITLQQRSDQDNTDDEGAPTEGEWTTLVDHMPAAQSVPQGSERLQQVQLSARYDARWEINYRSDMDPDLVNVPKLRRLVFLGRVHDITAAAVIGRRAGIELFTVAATRVE